jgi:hypothetical protein
MPDEIKFDYEEFMRIYELEKPGKKSNFKENFRRPAIKNKPSSKQTSSRDVKPAGGLS